jgi:hypothetical protein
LFLKTDGAGNLSFSSDLPTTSFTGATVETSIADSDLVLIYDDSATAVRKMTKANLIAGVGGANTPAFQAYASNTASLVNGTRTKQVVDTEDFDTDSCFDSTTNYRFTPTTAGKYFVYGSAYLYNNGSLSLVGIIEVAIYKNGTFHHYAFADHRNNFGQGGKITVNNVINMNGTTDYLELYVRVNCTASPETSGGFEHNVFGAYRLIGV